MDHTIPGTRKAKTETFVVRSKKREDVLKRAVDIGGVEMVIEEKVKKEKVVVPEEKSATSQVNRTTIKSFFKYLLIGGSCCDQGMA